jgi:hypothetical protein
MKGYRHVFSCDRQKINRKKRVVLIGAMLALFVLMLNPQEQEPEGLKMVSGRIYRIAVPSNVQWTDTGYDVEENQTLSFSASGGISLQIGNPMAYCGPDGYDLKTVQQPIQKRNIGALIGKVVLLISIEVDEETGEETRNEMVEVFHIGSEKIVPMPISGRLFLGVNENVAEDNSGRFTVDIRVMDL